MGDVEGTSLIISGALRGNIIVNGPVEIDSTAVVVGNITAKSIQLNSGAVVEGNISLKYADVDLDSIF